MNGVRESSVTILTGVLLHACPFPTANRNLRSHL